METENTLTHIFWLNNTQYVCMFANMRVSYQLNTPMTEGSQDISKFLPIKATVTAGYDTEQKVAIK